MRIGSRQRRSFLPNAVMALVIGGVCVLSAQQPVPPVQQITLAAGRSTVLQTDFEISRIAVTNPAIADAVVVQPREILIDGKAPGTVSLIIWGASERRQYDVIVDPGISTLEQRLQSLFPGEEIHVSTNEEAIILSGRASSNSVSLRAAEIAAATSSKMKVVNLLQLPGGSESQQVMLQVRLAEVSRRALLELGVSLFTGVHGVNDWVARSTTQQFSSPTLGPTFGPPPQTGDGQQRSVTSLSDLLNLFLFNTKIRRGCRDPCVADKGTLPEPGRAEPDRV